MLISVIIPVYNKEAYLERAVECVRQQEYPDWEIIIVDDGSQDDSLAIARRLESPRIKVYAQENEGAGAARNAAMEKASGDVFAFLDADDIWHTHHLQALADVFSAFPDTGIASTRWTMLGGAQIGRDPDRGQVERVDYLQFMVRNPGYFCTITTAIRREAFHEAGGMKLFKRGQDFEYWTRLGIKYPVAVNHALTAFYDVNDTSITRRIPKSDHAHRAPTRSDYTPVVAMLYDAAAEDSSIDRDAVERFVDWRLSIGLIAAARSRDWKRVRSIAQLIDNWPRLLCDLVARRIARRST